MEIEKYIYTILKRDQVIMWSWGFHNPQALPNNNGLIFRVEGFKHKGWVQVKYREGKDLFVVILLNNKYSELHRFEDVYFDELVDVIDNAVERTSDYDKRVREQYRN